MVQLTSVLGALPFVLAASATSIDRRQQASQVVRLQSVENVAVRASGQILATNMNSANLYSIDPTARVSSTAVVVSGARGLSGIGEYAPDKFAVIGDKSIFSVDFTVTPPKSTLVKAITEANNLNGLAVLNNETVLVADAGKGSVYRFSMTTGAYSVAVQDATMAPSGAIPFGIDGIKVLDGVLWYTNIFKNSFHKVPIDATGKATGSVTTLWSDQMGDDLCIGPNGKLYVTTNGRNSVVEVDPATGRRTAVATVQGSTSCAFGRSEADKSVMYVGGGAGVFAVTVRL